VAVLLSPPFLYNSTDFLRPSLFFSSYQESLWTLEPSAVVASVTRCSWPALFGLFHRPAISSIGSSRSVTRTESIGWFPGSFFTIFALGAFRLSASLQTRPTRIPSRRRPVRLGFSRFLSPSFSTVGPDLWRNLHPRTGGPLPALPPRHSPASASFFFLRPLGSFFSHLSLGGSGAPRALVDWIFCERRVSSPPSTCSKFHLRPAKDPLHHPFPPGQTAHSRSRPSFSLGSRACFLRLIRSLHNSDPIGL